jgi:hypothetical protein
MDGQIVGFANYGYGKGELPFRSSAGAVNSHAGVGLEG